MIGISRLTVRGFKSIRELNDFPLRPLNLLIGANGAGKSNLISLFTLVSALAAGQGNLQLHVSQQGGADAFLHYGSALTQELVLELILAGEAGEYSYAMRLAHGVRDAFVFAGESILDLTPRDLPFHTAAMSFQAGHVESRLATDPSPLAKTILSLLRGIRHYQFHNTSATARIRLTCHQDDHRVLHEDGANLAAVLYRLQQEHPPYYHRIVAMIRRMAPFFDDFDLRPNATGYLMLHWRERGRARLFAAHQLSDGTLRAMALVTLLLQPVADLPLILILDEPELGLHPEAIRLLAGLIRGTSRYCQILVATQSPVLVDCFDADDIIVVERREGESVCNRLDPERLAEWLQEYALSELWDKNVLGGRPG